MIGCVIAMDTEAELLLGAMEIENTKTLYGKPVHIGRAGRTSFSSFRRRERSTPPQARAPRSPRVRTSC